MATSTMAGAYAWACGMAVLAQNSAASAAPAATTSSSSAWMAAGFVLLGVGVAIAVLEFFLPSGGILAIAAATSLIGSVACFFAYDAAWGVGALVLYLAGSPVAILLGVKLWTHTPLAKSMVLGGVEGDEEDGAPPESALAQPTRVGVGAPGSRVPVASLMGKSGVALTTMRPVGFVRLDDERIEAHAESGMIEAGTRVVVVECEGARVVVRAGSSNA
jgi:membrane-bound serine protease (ClpP class)